MACVALPDVVLADVEVWQSALAAVPSWTVFDPSVIDSEKLPVCRTGLFVVFTRMR